MNQELMLILLFILIIVAYILATIQSSRHFKKWPIYRSIFWILAVISVAATVMGPLA